MRPYETEVSWLKKLVSGYFVSEQQIKFDSCSVSRTSGPPRYESNWRKQDSPS